MSLTKVRNNMIVGAPVNVLDFGAVGNGVTDDTAAIQGAIDFQAGGGRIFIPAGKYKLSAALVLHSGLHIYGSSNVDPYYGTKNGNENPSFLFQTTAGTPVFSLGVGVIDCLLERFSISDVSVPAAYTVPTAGKYGIEMTGDRPYSSYRHTLRSVSFYNFDRAISVVGVDTGAGVDWQIDNVLVERCTFWNNTTGIYFNTLNADDWIMQQCKFVVAANGDAIYCERSGYLQVIGGYSHPSPLAVGGVVSGTDYIHLSDFTDNILLQGCQSESMENFIHVDASTGYENVYNLIILDGCLVEVPSLIERQCKIVSENNRFTYPVNCTGDNIEVHSAADSWQTPASNGTHNGGNGSPALVDSIASWTVDVLVGKVVTNITDGSSGTITSNTRTTVTAILNGGASNAWDSGDAYYIPAVDYYVMTGATPNLFIAPGGNNQGQRAVLSATATTLFTLLDTPAMYTVYAYIADASAASQSMTDILHNGTTITLRDNADGGGTAMVFSLSGSDVQVTQNTGVIQTVHYRFMRLG